MHLFVSGASGLVGTELTSLLERRNHEVTQLVRRPPAANQVQWHPAAGTLSESDLQGADGFIHLSGESIAEGHGRKPRNDAFGRVA